MRRPGPARRGRCRARRPPARAAASAARTPWRCPQQTAHCGRTAVSVAGRPARLVVVGRRGRRRRSRTLRRGGRRARRAGAAAGCAGVRRGRGPRGGGGSRAGGRGAGRGRRGRRRRPAGLARERGGVHQVDKLCRLGLLLGVAVLVVRCRRTHPSAPRPASLHHATGGNRALVRRGRRGRACGERTDVVQVQAVRVVARDALEEGVAVLGRAVARLDHFACAGALAWARAAQLNSDGGPRAQRGQAPWQPPEAAARRRAGGGAGAPAHRPTACCAWSRCTAARPRCGGR